MTEKLYWQDPFGTSFEARVIAVEPGAVILDRSLFYPEGGGQLGDRGALFVGRRTVAVTDVQIDDDGAIRHLVEEPVELGASVTGTIDRERRRDHMSQHTGQHVLSRALIEVARAETVSARLGEGSCTIDTDKSALDDATLARAEDLVNELVLRDVPVRSHFPSPDELAQMPLRRAPKVATGVRVIEVEGFDFTPCGGTHVDRSGQIGPIKIVSVEKYKGSVRVSFAAGRRALADARAKDSVLRELARAFTCGIGEVPAAVAKLRADLKTRTEAYAHARGELMQLLAERLLAAHPVDPLGTRILVVREGDDLQTLRTLAGALAKRPDVIAFAASREASGDWSLVVERGASVSFDAGAWFKRVATAHGGRGGGRPERAEGRLPGSVDLVTVIA